ncbi:MAG: tetratricopeptide repeat protein [Candidatus Thorarchaeota archaeon]|nr:tetratricopeptide repeat protein [Candidatus Thorarchaeota archaeon]
MTSTTEQFKHMGVEVYLDLITSSLDIPTLNNPDTQIMVNDFADKNHAQVEIQCLLRIEKDKEDSLAWSLLGMCLMLRAEDEGAMVALTKAVEFNSTSILALNLLGDYYCCKGEDKEGEELYWDSLHLKDEQVHPRKMLYFQFMARKEYEKALQVIEPVLKIRPDDPNTWVSLAECFSKMDPQGFVEGFVTRLTYFHPKHYRAWYMQGKVFYGAGRLEEAEESVRKAITLKKKDALSWVLLANILGAQGKHNKAVYCCKRAVKIQPRNQEAWLILSLIQMKAGQTHAGKLSARKAVSINPQSAKVILDYLGKNEKE